ncbi:MAG TPA: GrpB family protein [Candidatus Saccharimonadales bacterium]|nr:GrpB family protein [Candidatus Saccharimonadales bacterium]
MSLGVHREKVRLEPHDPNWALAFDKEKDELQKLLKNSSNIEEIMHVGSTSIPDIMAKPLLDILMVVKDLDEARSWVPVLEAADYHLRDDMSDHLMFAKGPEDNRTVHLHVGQKGEEYIDVTTLFKEYLLKNPAAAKDYEKLKIKLAAKYPNDRKSYSPAKKDFIQNVLKAAKAGRDWS